MGLFGKYFTASLPFFNLVSGRVKSNFQAIVKGTMIQQHIVRSLIELNWNGFCLEVKTYRLITITLSKSSTDDGSIKISSFWWYVRIVDDRPWDTGSRGGLFTCIKGSLRLTKGNVTPLLLQHQKRFSICNCSFAIFMLFTCKTSDYSWV